MRPLTLDFYGARVRLDSPDEESLAALRRDFEWFEDPDGCGPAISWLLERRAARPEELPEGLPGLATTDYLALDAPGRRTVRYFDGAAAVYDYDARRGALYCADGDRLRELAYLAVLSRAGEALDERGLHRVHALGFSRGTAAGLVLMPSGGGKSVLGLSLLSGTSMELASDDAPLVCRRCLRLHAFPLRLGFREDADLSAVPPELVRPFKRRHFSPKRLVDLAFFKHRVCARAAPVRWLLIGRRGASPSARPASRAAALAALAENMVVGRGLAQMAEYMARPTPAAAARLARIAASRWSTALALSGAAAAYTLTLGPDSAENARFLDAFLGTSAAI
jgi:hypothetical protein